MRGPISAESTTGQVCVWTKSADSSLSPTGSAAFDFYGSNRLGDNLFANSLIALNANTGKRVWHFQAVKHDLWDRDFPAPPTLVTVTRDGRSIDAVAQITKSGYVWVFDRETGKSLFPMEYRKVAQTDVDGEATAGTQPFPLLPPPFARQKLTEDIVTERTPQAHAAVLEHLRQLRNGDQFNPPSLQGTVILPGFDGGGEWGGAAFDPSRSSLRERQRNGLGYQTGGAPAEDCGTLQRAEALRAEVRWLPSCRPSGNSSRSFRP